MPNTLHGRRYGNVWYDLEYKLYINGLKIGWLQNGTTWDVDTIFSCQHLRIGDRHRYVHPRHSPRSRLLPLKAPILVSKSYPQIVCHIALNIFRHGWLAGRPKPSISWLPFPGRAWTQNWLHCKVPYITTGLVAWANYYSLLYPSVLS